MPSGLTTSKHKIKTKLKMHSYLLIFTKSSLLDDFKHVNHASDPWA